MMSDQIYKMSDLEKIYKLLNINIMDIDKSDKTFSPSVADTKYAPIRVDDIDLSKINLENNNNNKNTGIKQRLRFTKDDSKFIMYKDDVKHDKNDDDESIDEDYDDTSEDDSKSDEEEYEKPKWSGLTHIYIGSLTVIGLYAMFRALQRN
jgi:hypothetical protein